MTFHNLKVSLMVFIFLMQDSMSQSQSNRTKVERGERKLNSDELKVNSVAPEETVSDNVESDGKWIADSKQQEPIEAEIQNVGNICQNMEQLFHPSMSNCRNYIECVTPIHWVEKSCQNGLLWNADGGYCDYPNRVDCGERPFCQAVSTPVSNPRVKNCKTWVGTEVRSKSYLSICPDVICERGELVPKHQALYSGQCSPYFCICDNGVAYKQKCPGRNSRYDDSLQTCNFITRVAECRSELFELLKEKRLRLGISVGKRARNLGLSRHPFLGTNVGNSVGRKNINTLYNAGVILPVSRRTN